MTSQEMLDALDALIERWTEARNILASLGETDTVTLLAEASSHKDADVADERTEQPAQTPTVIRLRPRQQRERRPRVRHHEPLPRALAAPVSSAPVVVPAAAVARSREVTLSALPTQNHADTTAQAAAGPKHRLDALIQRELAQHYREEALQ